MDFIIWLFLESVQKYIRSRKETSPKNPANTFLVLYGADPEELELMYSNKDVLKRLGFRYFRGNGTYSLFSTKLTPEARAELERIGVDLTGYDSPVAPVEDPVAQTPVEPSKSDETLEKMHSELEKVKTADKKAKSLIDSIEKMIEHVANGTDEAAKQSFIRNFLDFASKFYNYSFHNQMLIWIQTRGQAHHVAGAKQWEQKFGRAVKDWKAGISILAPARSKKEFDNPSTGERETRESMYFIARTVYDVTATAPIPGHPKSFNPVSRKDWSKDSNEEVEEIKKYIEALGEWANEQGIKVDTEEMEPEKGGYSAGGRIAINSTFKGINMFSTYVHEVAHEILHWKDKEGKLYTRQQKEIDAETTAYIVLKHFGFETQDTTNYLALWQATGEDIRSRRKNIQKAAMEIINGIRGKIDAPETEGEEEQDAVDPNSHADQTASVRDKVSEKAEDFKANLGPRIRGLENDILNLIDNPEDPEFVGLYPGWTSNDFRKLHAKLFGA